MLDDNFIITGLYEPDDDVKIRSIFLGPEKMSVKDLGDDRKLVRGVVPVPIREDAESGLVAAMKPEDRSNIYKTWNAAIFTDRDGGFFDNLSPVLRWASKPGARKDIYEYLRLRGSSISPYHGKRLYIYICIFKIFKSYFLMMLMLMYVRQVSYPLWIFMLG